MASNSRKTGVLAVVTAGVMLLAVYMIFFYLPPIKGEAGEVLSGSFRIFFFHMPIAIISYLAFGVVFAASILYLREKSLKWDIYARSAAEVGTLFAFLVLVTGSIWGKGCLGMVLDLGSQADHLPGSLPCLPRLHDAQKSPRRA